MEVNNFSDTYLEDLNKVDNLMRNKEYDEAIKICNRYIYLDRVKFQSKKISMLIKLNKISEAIKECYRLKFLENNEITFLKIEALYISGRIEEALYICDENSDKLAFVVKKIELLRKQRRLEEALKECNETKFKYSEEISKHREKILYRIEQNRKISSVEKEYKENKEKVDSMISDNISILLTKIYIDDITYNEIKDADIDKWYKDILLIAYYEKHNRIMGLNLIKELKKDYANDKDKIKTLNNLFNR